MMTQSKSMLLECLKTCPPIDNDFLNKSEKHFKSIDKISLTEHSFILLLNFIQSALVHTYLHKDYKTAHDLLFASTKFYMNQNKSFVVIINRLKNTSIWRETSFWTEYFLERSQEKLKVSQIQNLCLIMIAFGMNCNDIHAIIQKHVQHISSEDISQLLANLHMYENSFTEESKQENFDLYHWLQIKAS